jgi:hypothetical protein
MKKVYAIGSAISAVNGFKWMLIILKQKRLAKCKPSLEADIYCFL